MMDVYMLKAFVLFIFGVCFITGQTSLGECGCQDRWIKYSASCYFIGYHQAMTFKEAERFCERLNAHLVHVDTAKENNFLKNYLSRRKEDASYWIGASDRLIEGIWNYVDTGDLLTFTDWSPGQPDSWHAHNEDCALFFSDHAYKRDDGPCFSKLEPICEMR